jgi:hypothetical protein
MSSPPHPAQWLLGRSGAPYFLGLFVVTYTAFFAGQLTGEALFPSGPAFVRPDLTIEALRIAVMSLIGGTAVFLYAYFVPRQVPIGVSPFGLTVNFGGRYKFYNWQSIHISRSTIYCFSDRGGIQCRLAASPDQLALVTSSLQRAHAWAGWALSGRVSDMR